MTDPDLRVVRSPAVDPSETGSQDPVGPPAQPSGSFPGGPPPGGIPAPGSPPGGPQAPVPTPTPMPAPMPGPLPVQPAGPQQEPVLMAIGDIAITQNWIIAPGGSAPLAGSQWIVQDTSMTTSGTPTVAVVLAIIFFFFCLLGLLFLLMKEERVSGAVQVTVRSGSFYHVASLPVSSRGQIHQIHQMVQQAQGMAHAATPQ